MFFTQEDYRKIEKWLLANSVKDTEFAGASLPLKGNETVAFVQDGKNVNVLLKDLIEQIFLLGVSDFLNVTDKYGESRISLTQAIQLIPYKSRKIGQVITFLDEDGEWKLFQFQGERVNQWNNATLWVDLIERIQGISIIDSEDITATVDNLNQTSLTFADKNYNTTDYSGLGRVYLRKNIQTVVNPNTGITYSTNLLTQQMLNKENTIYVLQYDYSLNYQTISIPEGSILVFEGGDINNGTLNCNSTIIVGKFRGNATIAGTYSFQDAQADEEDITQSQSSVLKFKNKGYDEANFSGLGRTYLRKNIVNGVNVLTQDMINNPNTIYHIQYDYNLNGQTITIPSGCVLLFEGGSISNGNIKGIDTIIDNPSNNIIFDNIIIQGAWLCSFIDSNWFKEYNEGTLRNIMSLSNPNILTTISIKKGSTYIKGFKASTEDKFWATIYDSIQIPSNTIIDFNGGTLKVTPNNRGNYIALCVYNSDNIEIKNVTIIGDSIEHLGSTGEFGFGISVIGGENITIDNCYITNMWGDGLFFDSIYDTATREKIIKNTSCTVNNVICDDNRRQGLSILSAYDTIIKNSSFINTGKSTYTAPGAGIDIEPEDSRVHLCKNIIIDSCTFYNNKNKYDISMSHNIAQDSMIIGCKIRNCTIKGLLLQKNTDTSVRDSIIKEYTLRIHTSTTVDIQNCELDCPVNLIGEITGKIQNNNVSIDYGDSESPLFDVYVIFINEGCDATNLFMSNNNFVLKGNSGVKEFFYYNGAAITAPVFTDNNISIDNFRYRLRIKNTFSRNNVQLSGNVFLGNMNINSYIIEENVFKSLPNNYITLYTDSNKENGTIILRNNKFVYDVVTHDLFSEAPDTKVAIIDYNNEINNLPFNYMYGNISSWNITPLIDGDKTTSLYHHIQFDDNGKAYFKGTSASLDINSDGTMANKVVII